MSYVDRPARRQSLLEVVETLDLKNRLKIVSNNLPKIAGNIHSLIQEIEDEESGISTIEELMAEVYDLASELSYAATSVSASEEEIYQEYERRREDG